MVTAARAERAGNGIAIPKALVAGGVMALHLNGGQTDTTARADRQRVDAGQTRMPAGGRGHARRRAGQHRQPDKVANPDNLKFSEKMRTLFIGEDSSTHVNNFLWAYNVDTKQLSRVMSMPGRRRIDRPARGRRDQRLDLHHEQFPARGRLGKSLHDKVKPTLDPLMRANYKDRFGAAVGYLTAEPTGIRIAQG